MLTNSRIIITLYWLEPVADYKKTNGGWVVREVVVCSRGPFGNVANLAIKCTTSIFSIKELRLGDGLVRDDGRRITFDAPFHMIISKCHLRRILKEQLFEVVCIISTHRS